MREVYGREIVDALRAAETSGSAVTRAIDWLLANLTDAALAGCHHCGEAESPEAPCRWCGLRDRPRTIRRARSRG